MISDELGLTINRECDFNDYSSVNMSKACNDASDEAYQVVGDYINNYDVILDVCYPSIVEQELRLKKLVCSTSHHLQTKLCILTLNSKLSFIFIFNLVILRLQR